MEGFPAQGPGAISGWPITPPWGCPRLTIGAHRREQPAPEVNFRTLLEKLVLEEYAPPAILINSRFDVLYLQGDTAKYLGMPKGEPSYNLFNLAHEDLRPKLLTVLHQAVGEKKTVKVESIPFRQARREYRAMLI